MPSKIIFLISTLSGGGAEKVSVTLANSILNAKIVTVYNTPSKYTCNSEQQSLSSYSNNQLIRILKIPKCLLKYCYILKKEKPLVSISALPVDNLLNIFSQFICKVPAIITVHGMPSHNYNCLDRVVKYIIFYFARKTKTNIIAVSNGVKEELTQKYNLSKSQIQVIYNPIDISTVISLSKSAILDSRVNTDIPLLITVGRLNEVKGQWHIIRVFAELRKKQLCQLLICGEGPEKKYLLELVSRLGLEKDVIFLGWQENPYKYMAKSTLFIQSSLSEALPNVLIEAMATGCPIVAANCSLGIEEILGPNDKCGLITKKMSGKRHLPTEELDEGEVSLLQNIQKILGDVILHKQMSINARDRAKIFDVNLGVKNYLDLIKLVQNNKE